jgi:hypothetical protein
MAVSGATISQNLAQNKRSNSPFVKDDPPGRWRTRNREKPRVASSFGSPRELLCYSVPPSGTRTSAKATARNGVGRQPIKWEGP